MSKSEKPSAFYSKEELQTLQNHGVQIPSLDHICVGREVFLENIGTGAVLHPFCRITGKATKIYPKAQIGLRGGATLENSVVGSESIVGNQGAVTLLQTTLGPKTVLGSGEAENAVFLGKETHTNEFTTGVGFRVRKGSLYEEDASSAQHTDTKMTLLFPWVTLGSNINLCDLLLAGGVGPNLGDFTEVGSGTIHFNFTIRGDKATGSLLGNVTDGVFLKQNRLFIGGNNSLLGPLNAEFGALSAAGLRIAGSLKKGLNLGHDLVTGHREYDPRVFSKAKAIVANQIHYIGQLSALCQWYQMVRLPLAHNQAERQGVYQAGLQAVALNIQERIEQLGRFIEALEPSIEILSKHANPPQSVIQEQRILLESWPRLQKYLKNYEAYFELPPPSLVLALEKSATHHTHYTQIIQSLPSDCVQTGTMWLVSLVQRCEHFFHHQLKFPALQRSPMKTYYAHSENKAQQRHFLKDHLSSVAQMAQSYLKNWHPDEGYLAGLLHDLGKYGDLFQKRLEGKASGVDHWSQGTGLALQKYQSLAAAWVIQGHHVGLQPLDMILKCADLQTLSQKHPLNLNLSEKNLASLEQRLSNDGLIPQKPQTPIFTKYPQGRVDQMLDVRRLFSALVDADFIDTEAHFQGNETGKQKRSEGVLLQAEKAMSLLLKELDQLASNSTSPEEVIAVRNALKTSCLQQAQNKTGLFTLTAPTGSGKTLAMLAFALQHAIENNLERIIMVIPYLTIIEQTAAIYRRIFEKELGTEYVLEHHSMASWGTEEETEDSEGKKEEAQILRRKRLFSENWDAPLIVTTSVQCLNSLFSNRSSSCRKIHRMANAVILLDEVQTIPNELAIPTLAAFSHMASEWNTSVVFSTATQPAFQHLDEQVRQQATQGWAPQEIADLPEVHLKKMKRVEYAWHLEQPLSWSELAQQMTQPLQSLAIVNLKQHAKELFETLKTQQQKNIFHLSTNLCPAHRTHVLDQVKANLKNNEPCFLVSTQCVEAGVDLDFPQVWRALAPLEAIIQAAGRCNREGKLPNLGKIHVFLPNELRYPAKAYQQAALLTQLHAQRNGIENFDLEDAQRVQAYYQELYKLSDLNQQNQPLQEAIKAIDFPEVAQHYRLIEQNTINILVPWEKEQALFESLHAQLDEENLTKEWFQKARLLSVSLYRPSINDAIWDSLLPIEGKHKTYNDWFLLANHKLYDTNLGLLPADLNLWIA